MKINIENLKENIAETKNLLEIFSKAINDFENSYGYRCILQCGDILGYQDKKRARIKNLSPILKQNITELVNVLYKKDFKNFEDFED